MSVDNNNVENVNLFKYAFSYKHISSITADNVNGEEEPFTLNQKVKITCWTILGALFAGFGAIPAFLLATGHYKLANKVKHNTAQANVETQKTNDVALDKLPPQLPHSPLPQRPPSPPPPPQPPQPHQSSYSATVLLENTPHSSVQNGDYAKKQKSESDLRSSNDVIPTYLRGRLPPPFDDGIKVGLPNFSEIEGTNVYIGNICWLNSFLKQMASSTKCDAIFDVDTDTLSEDGRIRAALSELQKSLYNVILALRKNKEVFTIASQRLTLAINAAFSNLGGNVGVSQLDAAEFLETLRSIFCLRPEQYPESSPRLLFLENQGGHSDQLQWQIAFGIPYEQAYGDEPINIDEHIVTNEGPLLINAPEQLEVKFSRSTYRTLIDDEEKIIGYKQKKCQRPLELSNENTITLSEYEPKTTDGGNIIDVYLKKSHQYQITSAIIQQGVSSNSGHYVAVLRHNDGTYSLHDDGQVTALTSEEAHTWLQQAYLLQLRRIS